MSLYRIRVQENTTKMTFILKSTPKKNKSHISSFQNDLEQSVVRSQEFMNLWFKMNKVGFTYMETEFTSAICRHCSTSTIYYIDRYPTESKNTQFFVTFLVVLLGVSLKICKRTKVDKNSFVWMPAVIVI